MSNKNYTLPDPIAREEQYLSRIALGTGTIPEYPIFRKEFYLDYICQHSGGDPIFDEIATDDILSKTLVGGSAVEFASLNSLDGHWHIANSKVDDTFTIDGELELGASGDLGTTLRSEISNVGVAYETTAPTADNTEGLKIVVLDAEPGTFYDGWLYLIKEA